MRVIDLFCGAGGLSSGLIRAGFEVVQAYDNWSKAVETYRQNVGPHVWKVDLGDILRIGPMIAALNPQVLVGGPPCQDFSTAGDRIEGDRAAMTPAFAMLACISRPEWIVMENVPRAARSAAWTAARAMLVKSGYGLTEAKLNASFFGVPQSRKRLFVIGRLGETDGFLNSALAAARSKRPSVIADFLHVPEGYVYCRPVRAGRGVRSLQEPFPTVTRTSWEPPRPKYLGNPHPHDPVPAGSAHVMSEEQLALIQGFRTDWRWPEGSKRDVYQLIANAVPSPLAEAIGRVILARAAGESIPEIPGRFGHWLARKGFTKQSVRNAKTRLNRARRLLKGRTYADRTAELAAIEAIDGFQMLPTATKSDLRTALRLFWEWQTEAMKQRLDLSRTTEMNKAMAA